MEPIFLIPVAFFSSLLTAVIGMGGGVLLISLMPGLIAPAAIIPIHGMVQLASNSSRALFGLRHVSWRLLGVYSAGALLGVALGARWAVAVPERVLPLLLGTFILLVTWLPGLAPRRWPGRFFTVGAIQTFISLFVGAAGPLVSPLLLREGLPRDRLVVTHGAMMTVIHGLKVVAFLWLGFSIGPYLLLVAGMAVSVVAGSWAGTRLRGRIPEQRFRSAFKIVLTLLAVRLLFSALR